MTCQALLLVLGGIGFLASCKIHIVLVLVTVKLGLLGLFSQN